jgi:hypothetical protein
MVGRRLRQLKYGLRLGPFREIYARSGAIISEAALPSAGARQAPAIPITVRYRLHGER